MRTVWKYELDQHNTETLLTVPAGAKFLAVGFQGDCLVVWAEVWDSEGKPSASVVVHVVGTGHEVPERVSYLGTVQVGAFVFHVYVEAER
jgi:hypothetical protein